MKCWKDGGNQAPLYAEQIWAIRFFLDREGPVRDRTLFELEIDSKLRGCDLVKIKIGDLERNHRFERERRSFSKKLDVLFNSN